MFSKIGVISLPVADQERAKKFFTEVLDFTVVRDEPYMEGMRWIEVAPEGAATTLTLTMWFENMQPGGVDGLVLKTSDIDKAHKAVKNSDAKDVTEVDRASWGTSFMFKDTEGNGWIVQQD